MKLKLVKIDSHVDRIFEYINVTINVTQDYVYFEFFKLDELLVSGKYSLNFTLGCKSHVELKKLILKRWVFDNITESFLILELLVVGCDSYYIGEINFDRMYLHIRRTSSERGMLDLHDTYVLREKEVLELLSATKKIMDLLSIKGFPLNMLRDGSDLSNFHKLIEKALEDNPKIYKKVFNEKELMQIAILRHDVVESEPVRELFEQLLT